MQRTLSAGKMKSIVQNKSFDKRCVESVHRLNTPQEYISSWLVGDDFHLMKCYDDKSTFRVPRSFNKHLDVSFVLGRVVSILSKPSTPDRPVFCQPLTAGCVSGRIEGHFCFLCAFVGCRRRSERRRLLPHIHADKEDSQGLLGIVEGKFT